MNDKNFPEEGAHRICVTFRYGTARFDTGHFALEDKLDNIAPPLLDFLCRPIGAASGVKA